MFIAVTTDDLDLLDVMKYLEEDNLKADDDSALAPLTQAPRKESQPSLNKTLGDKRQLNTTYVEPTLNSDDEDELDFTMILADELADLK